MAIANLGEEDRWRVARHLISTYGDTAEIECGRRAADFLKQRNLDGFYLWQNIALKIAELRKLKS